MSRRILVPLGICAGAWVVGVVLAPAAFAHATVVSSSPADGARLAAPPSQVVITFDEPVGLNGIGYLHVTNASGDAVDRGSAFHPGGDPTKVADRLRSGLGDSSYLASYRVISADSHPVAGSIAFVVGHGALVHGSVEGASAVNTATAAAGDIARWAGYAGLALLGGCWLVFTVWSSGRAVPAARRLIWTGWAVLTAATVAQILIQGPYTAGSGLSGVGDFQLLDDTLHTDFGATLCVRLLFLSALAVVFERTLRAEAVPSRNDAIIGALGIGVVASFSLVGHASTTAPAPLSMALDALHLSAMAVWVGGLVMLLAAVLPRRGSHDVEKVLAQFSTVAFVSVVTLAVTGSYAAWRGVGTVHAVFTTTYGLLVLAKVVLLVCVVLVANLSRKNVRQRTLVSVGGAGQSDDEAVHHELLRRSVIVETVIAAVVLAVTAVLVNEPRGKEALAAQYREPVSATARLGGQATVTVTIEPAVHGPVDLTVVVRGEPHAAVTATATQSAAEIGPLPIALRRTTGSEFDARASLPVAGRWDIDLVVSTSTFVATTTSVTLTLH